MRKREVWTNERLYPSRFSDRFYPLSLLREAIRSVAETHLVGRDELVLIDFGCGFMPYRPILEKYVGQYIGVDIPGNEVADFYADIESRTQLPDNFADVVLSTQVLEHVPQPITYLKECYRLLKPGGILILSTHGYWIYHPDPQDLWRWTADGLKRIIQDAGFEIVDFQGLMSLASTAIQLFQDALMPKVPKFLKSIFAFLMQRLAILMDKVASPLDKAKDACIFLLVARKGG